ncbi:MAG: arylsulfatase [Lentisphaeraceae bacterium]|nr:arylsulfatase [Lentisphaeraceae bacterium]
MNKIFALCLLLAFGLSLKAQEKPNVIYILADDLGWGDLSIYGQKKMSTPQIDKIGLEGLKFTDHYSGNTVCSPSRAVLLTGKHSGRIYLRGNVRDKSIASMKTELKTLPEIMQDAGYATGAFGKWGLGITSNKGVENPLNHGFDEFVGWKSQMIAHTYYPTSYVENGKEIPLKPNTFVHDIIMNKAFDFIKKNAKADKPFFCYIPTAVPHAAMHAPPELHKKWQKVFPQFNKKIGKYGAGPGEKCPPVKNPIAGFAAMMENLDNQIGFMMNMLKEFGIDDNTIVIFTSDNGAHKEGGHDPVFWNSTGGLKGHKRVMHEGGIRVPMLVRWPKHIKAGRVSKHQSSFQDVLPTICELIDQPIPANVDGISFLPELKGESQAKHKYLYWEFRKGNEQKLFSQAVRMGKWKAYREAGKKIQLYNLDKDRGEKTDIASKFPEVVGEIEKAIKDAHRPLPNFKK